MCFTPGMYVCSQVGGRCSPSAVPLRQAHGADSASFSGSALAARIMSKISSLCGTSATWAPSRYRINVVRYSCTDGARRPRPGMEITVRQDNAANRAVCF